jgi:hypothetical protein
MARHQVAAARGLRAVGAWTVSVSVAALSVLSAGLAAAPAAFASIGVINSVNSTGYVATGRWFRYVQTEITLPTNAECVQLFPVVSTDQIGQNYYSLNTELVAQDGGYLGVNVVDAPSAQGCVAFEVEAVSYSGATAAMDFQPSAGDTIEISVYYDSATDTAYGSLTDLTTGQTAQTDVFSPPGEVYTSAQVTSYFGAFNYPASQFRAFPFTGSAATTETGDHGTMTGPWTTSQLVMDGGTKGSPIEANCPILWNGGRNFSTYVRAKS